MYVKIIVHLQSLHPCVCTYGRQQGIDFSVKFILIHPQMGIRLSHHNRLSEDFDY